MLGQILLTSCLVMIISGWRIDVSENNVAMHLSHVSLDCRNHAGNDNSKKLAQITRLRILKRKPDNQWISLAKVTRNYPYLQTSLQNVNVTGLASNLSNSFINLYFPVATAYSIGQFVCEVEGHYHDEEMKHVLKTTPVVITQSDVTYQDMLNIILHHKQRNGTNHVNDHNIMFELLRNIINFLQLNGKGLEKINDITNQLTEGIKSVDQAIPSLAWPAGEYSLVKPNTGCSYSPTFNWEYSAARLITKPGSSNNDKTSSSSHLYSDTLQHDSSTNRNYAIIKMCSKSNEAVEGPAWPKGSYCIQKYDRYVDCPNGLTKGNIEVGKYHDVASSRYVTVNHPSSYEGQTPYTNQWYCCRKDGDANHPIDLPSTDPFYLYRYGGQCQEVKGMEVSNEWMTLDTNPKYDNYYTVDNFPDGQIKPLRLQLCYYKPRL